METVCYNLASIFLGLTAWLLPLVYLGVGKRRDLFCGGSFALCAVSLYFQLRETLWRVERRDFAGIEDTFYAVVFAATVLVTVTAVLNLIALLRRER